MQMGCKCSTSSSRVYEGFLLISVGHISFIWGWVRAREELSCALSKTGGEYSTYPLMNVLYLSIAKEHSQRNQLEILGSIKLSYVTDMKKNPIVQRNLIINNELRA